MDKENDISEREKLYHEVWTEPVTTVAKRYSLSDNGLRKRCKALRIPLPPVGYWAKKQAGKTVMEQPKLPPLPIALVMEASINQDSDSELNIDNYDNDFTEAFFKWCEKLIVPSNIKQYDMLIEQHIKEMALRKERESISYLNEFSFLLRYELEKGKSHSKNVAILDVEVSEGQRKRAYCFMHFLIQSIRELHGRVTVDNGDKDNTQIEIGGYHFICRLSEQKAKRRNVISEIQKTVSLRPAYEQVPTGILEFTLKEYTRYWHEEEPKHRVVFKFTDEQNQSLEQQIQTIFKDLYRSIIEMKKEDDLERLEKEKRESTLQQQLEEQKRIKEKQHRLEIIRQQKQELFTFSMQHMKKWNQTKDIHAYIDDVKMHISGLDEESQQKVIQYCSLINEYLDEQNLIPEIIKEIDSLQSITSLTGK